MEISLLIINYNFNFSNFQILPNSKIRLHFPKDVPKFSYIIEASDSYFSLNAIEYLMNKGVMVFQNSSTQMGPTISSSLELLLYLSLTDHEYHNFVQKKNGKISKQFQSYIDVYQFYGRKLDKLSSRIVRWSSIISGIMSPLRRSNRILSANFP